MSNAPSPRPRGRLSNSKLLFRTPTTQTTASRRRRCFNSSVGILSVRALDAKGRTATPQGVQGSIPQSEFCPLGALDAKGRTATPQGVQGSIPQSEFCPLGPWTLKVAQRPRRASRVQFLSRNSVRWGPQWTLKVAQRPRRASRVQFLSRNSVRWDALSLKVAHTP